MNRQIVAQAQKKSSMQSAGGVLQRKCDKCREEEKILQRSSVGSAPETVPPIVHEVLRSTGQPLDRETRAFFEPRFGYDLSHVRVHTDAKATESARAVNALAYTVGHDVVFGNEQYSPGTSVGRGLLAHELTHVVQQNKNKDVKLNIQRKTIDESVKQFEEKLKSKIDPYKTNPDISKDIIKFGQFFVTIILLNKAWSQITYQVSGLPAGDARNGISNTVEKLVQSVASRDVTEFRKNRLKLLRKLRLFSNNTILRNIEGLVGKDLRGIDWETLRKIGTPVYVEAWKKIRLGIKPDLPLCDKTKLGPTLSCVLAVNVAEKILCGSTATRVEKLFEETTGTAPKYTKLNLNFWDPRDMDDQIAKLKSELNKGSVVQARVLSPYKGFNWERTIKKKNEKPKTIHSILIIGHDGNKRFVFWDPDALTTELALTKHGRGYGFLEYYDVEKIFWAPIHPKYYRVVRTQ